MELLREMSTRVHQEVSLAKTEVSQKASQIGKGIGFLSGSWRWGRGRPRQTPDTLRRADPGARDLQTVETLKEDVQWAKEQTR